MRGERNRIGQRAAKEELRIAVIPVVERVAGAGRRAGVLRGGPGRIKDRSVVGAACGIEREPMALFDLGVHKDVRVRQLNGIGALRAPFVKVPAGDGERRAIETVRHADGADALAALALLRQDDAAVLSDEEHIQHAIEPRLDGDLRRGGDAAHGAEDAVIQRRIGARYVPADEFAAFLHGRGGAVERVAVRDDLLRHHCAVHLEGVGEVVARIRLDNSHGGNVCLAALFALRGLFVLAGLFALHRLFRRSGLIACVRNGVFVSGGVGAASRRGIVSIFGKKRFLCRDGPLVSNGDRVHREQGEHHAHCHQQGDQIPLFHTVLLFSLTSPSLSDNFGRKCTDFFCAGTGFFCAWV